MEITPQTVLLEKPGGKAVWSAIRSIFRLLATAEAQTIVPELLKNKEIRSKELLAKTGLTESQFHPVLKQLVQYKIVDRNVNQDRSVSYAISPFGRSVLELSKPLLNEISKNLKKQAVTN